MELIRLYLNCKKGNALPGNLPSPTNDNDNYQDTFYRENCNNTESWDNVAIAKEISSTSTSNIVESQVINIEPPSKKKKN